MAEESVIYGISSSCYLHRARKRLDENSLEGLFYAALELRSGVEARLREYLEFQEHIASSRKREWNVKKLGRTAESTFKIGDKSARYTFFDADTGAKLDTLYYTPITSFLRSEAEQLGNYLHAARTYRPADDPWWKDFRNRLEVIYRELWKATRGQLLGAPLINKKTRKMPVPFEWIESRPLDGVKPGVRVQFRVEYLDDYPQELLSKD